jgi:hypothetical protein
VAQAPVRVSGEIADTKWVGLGDGDVVAVQPQGLQYRQARLDPTVHHQNPDLITSLGRHLIDFLSSEYVPKLRI